MSDSGAPFHWGCGWGEVLGKAIEHACDDLALQDRKAATSAAARVTAKNLPLLVIKGQVARRWRVQLGSAIFIHRDFFSITINMLSGLRLLF